MNKHYMIVEINGEMRVSPCIIDTQQNRWTLAGNDERLEQALKIGLGGLDLADNKELGDVFLLCEKETRFHTTLLPIGKFSICFPVTPKEPEPLKGLAFLKSLTVGKTYRLNQHRPFMITHVGLAWIDGETWTWDGKRSEHNKEADWREYSWFKTITQETCPTWEPEEND